MTYVATRLKPARDTLAAMQPTERVWMASHWIAFTLLAATQQWVAAGVALVLCVYAYVLAHRAYAPVTGLRALAKDLRWETHTDVADRVDALAARFEVLP